MQGGLVAPWRGAAARSRNRADIRMLPHSSQEWSDEAAPPRGRSESSGAPILDPVLGARGSVSACAAPPRAEQQRDQVSGPALIDTAAVSSAGALTYVKGLWSGLAVS
jgi:hypothetical protein